VIPRYKPSTYKIRDKRRVVLGYTLSWMLEGEPNPGRAVISFLMWCHRKKKEKEAPHERD